MHRLANVFLLVLLTSPFASCSHWLQEDQLFYSYPSAMNYANSFEDCQSLGGQLPSNYTIRNIQFLQSIFRNAQHGFWLDAERTTSGYRWRLSGQLIEPEMWYPGSPDCEGDCAVYLGSEQGKVGVKGNTFRTRPLCVFIISNEATITHLLSKLSLFDEADRAGLLMTIVSFKQEKRIFQEHAIIQQLSNDLDKLETTFFRENNMLKHELSLSQKSYVILVVTVHVVIIITASIIFGVMHIRITRVDRSLRDRDSKIMDSAAEQPIDMRSLLNNECLTQDETL